MSELRVSERIAGLRRERKVTQEELADFLGVTKAAVSKWENGLTMPDILLLPQLAGFFGVTVDFLLGYEAQLSGEQIRRRYLELCEGFARLPFSEAMEQVHSLVRRYYACYPFLLQVCVLYLNHFMLAEREEEGRQILEDGVRLCERILEECRDAGVCQDAEALKAVLFSTHILSDVERVCDELAVLNEGKIVLQGPMDEVRRMCRSAAFVLEMERSQDAALLLEKFPFLQAQGRHGLLLKDAERLSELLYFIADQGLSFLRMERQETALEDLFLEVIGK